MRVVRGPIKNARGPKGNKTALTEMPDHTSNSNYLGYSSGELFIASMMFHSTKNAQNQSQKTEALECMCFFS